MLSKKKDTNQRSVFLGLEDMLNQKHPIYILANKVDWQLFEDSFPVPRSVTLAFFCSAYGSCLRRVKSNAPALRKVKLCF